MPAVHTESNLRFGPPHRMNLPATDYMTVPAVREAAELFLRVREETRHHESTVLRRAESAVRDAEAADERELADALLAGGKEPKPRVRTEKAEAALSAAQARHNAYRAALGMAYRQLRDAVVEHAPAWAEQVTADHADAIARLEQAAAEFDRAHRDAVATGTVLAMLRRDPASLTVGTYPPSVRLSMAHDPLIEAVAAVKAHERATAPAPAEDRADDEIAV